MNIHKRTINIEKKDAIPETDELNPQADYIICRADPLDSACENRLRGMGFRFLDRMLYFEIDLRTFSETSSELLSGINFICDDRFGEDVHELAHAAYTTDRRFHLEPEFNQTLANEVIDMYIEDFKNRGMKLYKATHEKELLGFTVVDEKIDSGGSSFENVLGATKPGIKGKMVAAPLYSAMLSGEREKFRKYVGRVSSSNVSSINLHFQLGGHIAKTYDEYIYEKKRR